MRIAYIILAHRFIDQLARLIVRLNNGTDGFYVHIDARADRPGHDACVQLQQRLKDNVDLRLLQRHRCYWGSLELVLATLEGISAVVASRIKYDRVILLSGQDYPIKSNDYIRSFLASHQGDEFIESFPLNVPNPWTRWTGPGRDISRTWHWHLRVRSRWIHLPIRRRFPLDIVPHGGSQWWALTLPCVQHIYRFVSENPAFLRYYKHALIADEQFFQTIIGASEFAPHVATNLTYTDSSRPLPPWPVTFRQSDVPALLRSPKLFARKFDSAQDPGILDTLDDYANGSRLPSHPPRYYVGQASAAIPNAR